MNRSHSRGLLLMCFSMALSASAPGQTPKKVAPISVSSLCTPQNATDIVGQQVESSKTFENSIQRIAVLIRAADLLWPYQQEKARTVFSEGFELAILNYKEKGEQTAREGRMPVSVADQRYLVIAAIARRDSAWARKLSYRLSQEEASEANQTGAKDPRQDTKNAEKLMNVAYSLLPANPDSALTFARSSLRYPGTIYLAGFLYKLSEVNKGFSDQFYQETLKAYANAPMDQFLYLSSYPFGNTREAGEMPIYTIYQVPNEFTPNSNLQRLFIQTLLGRVLQMVGSTSETIPGSRYSETAQAWMALSRLESQVQTSLPDLSSQLQQAKGSIYPLLSQKDQLRVTQ